MNNPNEKIILNIKPRPSETLSIVIPKDTLESLKEIANNQDMSLEALLKFYIGKGLRQDLAKLASDSEIVTYHH
ncbi:hypothetical protein [Aphanothece sacrum]|uniref:CopG family transcriptional regulator n=1 Tax=Aphanothece sacrum FPU1 TaxID=1920663 RepID=A0A401IIE7_APHSA|nr:hypothetical protein [Aphanothece sacrum]GBF80881.1 hypothetical protein AsFPU1_2289 [Aphanothece sacrum FPU1]GBF85188.1 hypothetical protein AsFPU3_2246 [Aphanothece sacrum FPU3]